MTHQPHTPPQIKPIRFGIAGKIWLAISIMLLGYLITMGQGGLVGKYTKKQHHHISEHLFPAALQAQTNLVSFKTQMEQFEDAVLLGEPEQLQTANNYTIVITEGLQRLTTDQNLPEDIRNMGNDLILRHETFSKQAMVLYTRMISEQPSEEILSQAAFLAETSEQIKIIFQTMSTELNTEMNDNLQGINAFFHRQQTASIIIFLATVTISILLVSFILAKTILRPLQKTVQLANIMASGDLSQKVDIRQEDEIGALANAMNSMADQLERSYSRMETIVAKRTLILRQTNEKLRLEVQSKQDAQQEIFTALENAKRANAARSTFLANMSHEIRTPMNGIIGMTSLLLETKISDIQQSYLQTLRASAQALLSILNDILDFGKIESGQLQLNIHEFNPLEVVADITDLVTLRVQNKGLEFFTLIDGKIPPILQGDQARLRQILTNITDNAIKFTKSGEVALKMGIEAQTARSLTLRCSVSDTGIGINPDELPLLFKPFTQGDDSTTRKYGGTGLGLAISKKLVELMDGKIHIESSGDKGTTVWFTATFGQPINMDHFPDYSQTPELVYATSSNQKNADQLLQLAGKTVLVADDEPTSQEVMMAILQTYGITPHVVTNGQQVLEALSMQSFDLILMDCQMPVLNGYQATTAIRRRDTTDRDIPIVALTADTTPGAKEQCLTAGMNDYLAKPVEPQRLKEYLLKWIQQEESETETLLSAQLVLRRQGGDQEKACQLLSHAKQITQIYLDELQVLEQNKFPEENVINLCTEIKKLGANLGIAKLQNQAIHLQLAATNKQHSQAEAHANSLQMSILKLSQEIIQAGKDHVRFFNS